MGGMGYPAKQCEGDGCTASVAYNLTLCQTCLDRRSKEDADTHDYAEVGIDRLGLLLDRDAAFKAWLNDHPESL